MHILAIECKPVFGAAQLMKNEIFFNGCLLFSAWWLGAEHVGDAIALLVRRENLK